MEDDAHGLLHLAGRMSFGDQFVYSRSEGKSPSSYLQNS